MNYPFLLKFSSISNLSDARYAAGMWADFIGFNFDPSSPSYTEPAKAQSIISWINGPALVGEFGNQPLDWITDFTKQLSIQIVQIPATYSDLNVFETGLKTIVVVNDTAHHPSIEKADILLTENMDVYKHLIELTDKPVIFQTLTLTEDASEFRGLAILGQTEDQPGTRNQAEWTEYLERFESED